LNKELLEKESHIFPIKDALMYVQKEGRYGQGSTFFKAPNPEFGATITYYIKDVPKTLKAERQAKEKNYSKMANQFHNQHLKNLKLKQKKKLHI
jgi:hypothetical protein